MAKPRSRKRKDPLEAFRSEIVFAFVAPTGTDTRRVEDRLRDRLNHFSYALQSYSLSSYLPAYVLPGIDLRNLDKLRDAERRKRLMAAGTKLRTTTKRGDVLALHAIGDIARSRAGDDPAFRRRAHLLTSLKHPEEVHTLRRTYGGAFFLIGIYTPKGDRLRYLRKEKNYTKAEAEAAISRDENEPVKLGQKTRDTFELADVYLDARDLLTSHEDDSIDGLWRFLDLVFGCPFVTPTRDEHAMFLAHAASLRSGSLGRQVGAAIRTATGDTIAACANDTPSFGGGQYWPGAGDHRDCKDRETDSNKEYIGKIVESVLRVLSVRSDEREEVCEQLGQSQIWDITEYGRDVHAEMETLLACARSGVSPRDGTLYTTTFPCHSCAKHIVGSGIREVIYIEPYPKSLASELFHDSIAIDESPELEDKVWFRPFVGIGPRRYADLFSLTMSSGYRIERKEGTRKRKWSRKKATPRTPLQNYSAFEIEEHLVGELIQIVESHGIKTTAAI